VRKKELQGRLDELRQLLGQVERHGDRMSTILMVREPGTSDAADAYEGLRKQLLIAVTERRSHLSQLVQLDDALSRGVDPRTLTAMVGNWLEQASLRRVRDFSEPDHRELFEILGDPGDDLEVVSPAYVDELTGRPVRLGRLRAAPRPDLAAALAAADGDGQRAPGEEEA
jgi:hypothetical protein